MSFFLLVPTDGPSRERAAELAKVVGAHPVSSRRADELFIALFAQTGGGRWSFLEVPKADARVSLDERLIAISELQEAAAGLGLDVELVGVVKDRGSPPPPLTAEYQALLEAMAALGGRKLSIQGISRQMGAPASRVRRQLKLLVQWRRILHTGRMGGSRYWLPGGLPGVESK